MACSFPRGYPSDESLNGQLELAGCKIGPREEIIMRHGSPATCHVLAGVERLPPPAALSIEFARSVSRQITKRLGFARGVCHGESVLSCGFPVENVSSTWGCVVRFEKSRGHNKAGLLGFNQL